MPAIETPTFDPATISSVGPLTPYRVTVLDCDYLSYEDVIVSLCQHVPGMTRDRAFKHAFEVDTQSASVVARLPRARAQDVGDQLAADTLLVRVEPD